MTFFDIVRQTIVGMYASNAELLKFLVWGVGLPIVAVGFAKWHRQIGEFFMELFEFQGYGVIVRDPDDVVQEKNREYYQNLRKDEEKEVIENRQVEKKQKVSLKLRRKTIARRRRA